MTLGLDESLLLDALRPPARMELDAAVGTTFTLDLTALLAIPVTAGMAGDPHGEDGADLLEVIRRSSDRTVLFCQAGAIQIPTKYKAALTFVEQTVVEIGKPAGGIFHPKVWVVRFRGDGRVVHRVLVATRNLTFDRAWDAVVRLDEDPQCTQAADLAGLVGFLSGLPHRAARPPTDGQRALLADLMASLAAARMAVPEPFTDARVVGFTPGGHGMPFARGGDAALAVSPFLTVGAVTGFAPDAGRRVVVSRRGSLDAVASGLAGVAAWRVKDVVLTAQDTVDTVLDGAPSPGSADPASLDDGDRDGDEAGGAVAALRGLHAKIYVQDDGERSTTWIGSANLTGAAFATNLEVLIELTGPRHLVGVDCLMDPQGVRLDLSRLVERHLPVDVDGSVEPADGIGELEAVAMDLASQQVSVVLTEDGGSWTASLSIRPWQLPEGVQVRARPFSLPPGDAVSLVDGTAVWTNLALMAITPFVVLELTGAGARRTVLVRASLVGDPEGRRSAVLAHAISSRDDFLRYLAALLGYDSTAVSQSVDGTALFTGWGAGGGCAHLLEDLLTTAARNPRRLASLGRTLAHLDADPGTRDLVPAEFRTVWPAVHAVCGEVIS